MGSRRRVAARSWLLGAAALCCPHLSRLHRPTYPYDIRMSRVRVLRVPMSHTGANMALACACAPQYASHRPLCREGLLGSHSQLRNRKRAASVGGAGFYQGRSKCFSPSVYADFYQGRSKCFSPSVYDIFMFCPCV
eukprot:6173148-Pleurochrysis_carterae.AAC.2